MLVQGGPIRLLIDESVATDDRQDTRVKRASMTVILAGGDPRQSLRSVDAEVRRVGFTELDHVSSADQTVRNRKVRSDMTAPVPDFAFALSAK